MSLGPTTILVIDDEPIIRRLLCRILGAEGYSTLEAWNGEEGLRLFREHTPDLVITDLAMPEKEGLETIQDIQALDASIPIIAMSGALSREFLTFAQDFGAVGAIAKPFTREDIVTAVEAALRTSSAPT